MSMAGAVFVYFGTIDRKETNERKGGGGGGQKGKEEEGQALDRVKWKRKLEMLVGSASAGLLWQVHERADSE